MSVHRETFTALVKQQGWTRGVELGVDKGILFAMLLRECPDLRLLGVDTFPDRTRSRRAFECVEGAYSLRSGLMEMTTHEASDFYTDGCQDFVFVDADHRYKAVAQDIRDWTSKVRTGGWFGGHDYHPRKFPGVVQAVDEAFGQRVQYWPGTIWGVWI